MACSEQKTNNKYTNEYRTDPKTEYISSESDASGGSKLSDDFPSQESEESDRDGDSPAMVEFLSEEQLQLAHPVLVVRIPELPEKIVKAFDLKGLSKYVDLFVVSTHNISDSTKPMVTTYHHSRLMGSADILNTVIVTIEWH